MKTSFLSALTCTALVLATAPNVAQATPRTKMVLAPQAPSAAKRMNQRGNENLAMAQQVGTWDVTETVWDSPTATPKTTRGLIAERQMVGSMLQEIIHSPAGSTGANIKRIDYLTFNRVEGHWQYVSMDARAPVGLMPATSFDRGTGGKITLLFTPFALAGSGSDVSGQMLRMDTVIARQGPNRDLKQQHFMLADGTGTSWLAHQYAYTRRR